MARPQNLTFKKNDLNQYLHFWFFFKIRSEINFTHPFLPYFDIQHSKCKFYLFSFCTWKSWITEKEHANIHLEIKAFSFGCMHFGIMDIAYFIHPTFIQILHYAYSRNSVKKASKFREVSNCQLQWRMKVGERGVGVGGGISPSPAHFFLSCIES